MNRQIIPGKVYRHFKGKYYRVISIATHTEDGSPYVVYQALYGDYRVYVRPYEMFASRVDAQKYPEHKDKFRFTLDPNLGLRYPINTPSHRFKQICVELLIIMFSVFLGIFLGELVYSVVM